MLNFYGRRSPRNTKLSELKELEVFFKEEGIIASNRDLYLPTFENN